MSVDAMAELDSLESLYGEVKSEIRRIDSRKNKPHEVLKSLELAEARLREVYLKEENWKHTRILALVHLPSHTLIGHYSEYTHKFAKGCRKLLREDSPLAFDEDTPLSITVEHVEGPQWLSEHFQDRVTRAETWHSTREVILSLVDLAPLGVSAAAVPVLSFLSYGGIAKVELLARTEFFSEDRTIMLELAAGTNILEVMSLDSKLSLRKELAI